MTQRPLIADTAAVSLLRGRATHSARALLSCCAGLLLALSLVAPAPAQTRPGVTELEQQYRRGDARGALQRLEQALVADPGQAPLRFLQAVLVADQGRSTEAGVLLERMIEDFPDLPEPYNNLAVLRAAAGQLDSARQLLEAALRLDPNYRAAQENLGDLHLRLALRAYTAAAQPASPGLGIEPSLQHKLQQSRELLRLLDLSPRPRNAP